MTLQEHQKRRNELEISLASCIDQLHFSSSKMFALHARLFSRLSNLEELLSGPEVTLTEEGKRQFEIIKGL